MNWAHATIRWSAAAALGIFVVSLPFSVTQQVYAAYQRTYVWNGFALAGAVLGFLGLLLTLRLQVPMPVLIFVSGLAGPCATMAAFVYATGRAMPWLPPSLAKLSRPALRALLSRSIPIFLFQISALVVNETQSILLPQRCDLTTVASYSIGMRVYMLIIAVIQIGTNSFTSALREAFERGDRDWTTRAFARLLRIGIATLGGLFLSLLGNTLLSLWLHRPHMAFGRGVWVAMAVLPLGAMWGTSYAELLSIMDRLWLNVAVVLGNGTITLLLTHYLSPRYQVPGGHRGADRARHPGRDLSARVRSALPGYGQPAPGAGPAGAGSVESESPPPVVVAGGLRADRVAWGSCQPFGATYH